MERLFPLGVVLSLATGKMLSRNGFGAIHEAIEYMAGGPVFTHQIPRVLDEIEPVLLARYPVLATVNADGIHGADLGGWLDRHEELLGAEMALPVMTPDQHQRIEPLSELVEKVHPSKIIVVGLGAHQ